jgi:hypothetical protein
MQCGGVQRLGIGLLGAFPPLDKGGRRRTTLGSSRQLQYGLSSWYGSDEIGEGSCQHLGAEGGGKTKGPREYRKVLASKTRSLLFLDELDTGTFTWGTAVAMAWSGGVHPIL